MNRFAALVARQQADGKPFVVRDGKEDTPKRTCCWSGLSRGAGSEPLQSYPSRSCALERSRVDLLRAVLRFRPVSRGRAYVAQQNDKWFVVLDGQERQRYHAVGPETRVGFIPTGSFTCIARSGDGYRRVEERKKEPSPVKE